MWFFIATYNTGIKATYRNRLISAVAHLCRPLCGLEPAGSGWVLLSFVSSGRQHDWCFLFLTHAQRGTEACEGHRFIHLNYLKILRKNYRRNKKTHVVNGKKRVTQCMNTWPLRASVLCSVCLILSLFVGDDKTQGGITSQKAPLEVRCPLYLKTLIIIGL